MDPVVLLPKNSLGKEEGLNQSQEVAPRQKQFRSGIEIPKFRLFPTSPEEPSQGKLGVVGDGNHPQNSKESVQNG